ncbi:ABC transporter ATP-binding protein [Pseudodonghicola flavimaris]|uniref:Spermidine/putrescine import ATP-binding protein PotA n=1 Tax=Pseudodonghicola flavimaris TaxID=3050036 RepID=A0ABT7F514_9RHOB|nr:ABC transporter ATP-binding protein [Pseudodonghicola flavimaris]MDK3019677.1 ABC transporter ATP-binding protein [Pseudodonghicola flavimaris]
MQHQAQPMPSTDSADDVAVDVDRISKIFQGEDEVRALDDVSVAIRRNEFFTLLGPSGCGKTTLLRVIAGFEPPTMGALRLGGRDISRLPPNKRPINTVFQNYALFPHMSVANNIAFGLEMLGKPKGEIQTIVYDMLKLVQMEHLKARRTSEISGGQQQRVALARALAPKPEVLLLDEPLSALDLKLRKEMQIELKRLQHETGITFIFVTHDQEEALTMSDRIAVMNAGKILQVGSPRDIYERPAERFVANFIGESNFLDATLNGHTVTLKAGGRFQASPPAGVADGAVSVLVRPEHGQVRMGEAAEGELAATIDTVVYSGEATTVHLRLTTGELFKAKMPNTPSEDGRSIEQGAAAALSIAPGAVTVLKD